MSPVRLIILVLAAMSAIGLAVLVRGMAAGPKPGPTVAAAPPQIATVRVLTAKVDIPVGKTLGPDDVIWRDWPQSTLSPAFITDGAGPNSNNSLSDKALRGAAQAASTITGANSMGGTAGSVAREPFTAGEPIMARKLVRADQGGYMSVVLAPGMRAMSLAVSVDSSAGGFVLPGDRVDVLLSQPGEGANARSFSSRVVMQNLKILAIDQATEAAKGAKSLVGAVATLEVPGADAPAMARLQATARNGSSLSLALRSYADIGAPVGAATSEANGEGHVVQVFRAGQSTDVAVMQ
jgi:pilus assembly protein CpaB